MPRDKVLALWEEARRHAPPQAVPPVDAVLSQATYEAQLNDRRTARERPHPDRSVARRLADDRPALRRTGDRVGAIGR